MKNTEIFKRNLFPIRMIHIRYIFTEYSKSRYFMQGLMSLISSSSEIILQILINLTNNSMAVYWKKDIQSLQHMSFGSFHFVISDKLTTRQPETSIFFSE